MEFTTCILRPLEKAQADWNTPENIEIYFDMAKDVLVDAGVVVRNRVYDPTVPYSEELLITRPERICSYDETKLEPDCNKVRACKRDRCIRYGPEDDGEALVTKLERCASATCGGLSDGRALPVYIVFGSRETNNPAWAPEITIPDMLHKYGAPSEWPYT